MSPEQQQLAKAIACEMVARSFLTSLAKQQRDPQRFLEEQCAVLIRGLEIGMAQPSIPSVAIEAMTDAIRELFANARSHTFNDFAGRLAKGFQAGNA